MLMTVRVLLSLYEIPSSALGPELRSTTTSARA